MLYPEQDIEMLGDYYIRHVEAMTAEGLHEKSDIAAQLAWRDREIERLKAVVEAAAATRLAGKDLDAAIGTPEFERVYEIAEEASDVFVKAVDAYLAAKGAR